MKDYGLDIWGDDNFIIDEGLVKVNHKSNPSLLEITKEVREFGIKGPILIRFPHLIDKQIESIFSEFGRAIKDFEYEGAFRAVFPLKVNHSPNFVEAISEISTRYDYGLEAGSKAEMIIAMTYTKKDAPITVNGFKDKEMITLGFIASSMGHDITLTIEGLNELETIIEVANEFAVVPNIGLRIRLHSSGIGIWAKSGGINSKFGLTSTELLEAIELLRNSALLEKLSMIHFHIGSQIGEISPLKKAIREAGNIYANLKKMGAINLNAINIGGGLAIEYSQKSSVFDRNYTITEFANDVVFLLKDIALRNGVNAPDIFTESGRFVSAPHSVLVAPVLELFSSEYNESLLRLKEENPQLISELYDLYKSIDEKSAIEYLHDSLDHMESILTLFDLGYIDLEDRSNCEILVHLIIKKVIKIKDMSNNKELRRLQDRVQEKYLVNFSMFQSLPDYWGLNHSFPVMPISNLETKATRSASIWDITCDSDGEIAFDVNNPLFLHDIDPKVDEYFIGFFLVGAYQEVLGMNHNLFTRPTEVSVLFDEVGNYTVNNIVEAQSVLEILNDLDYNLDNLLSTLKTYIAKSKRIGAKEKESILNKLTWLIHGNGYLKTTTG